MNGTKPNKFTLLIAVICWFTVILQGVLILQNRVTTVVETIIRFFTFFTILTNILVAITFTVIWMQPKNRWSFFLKPNIQTAIAVYIFVVGFVYNIILRFLWQPQGLQKVVDELLHTAIPIIYILYWYLKTSKESIFFKNVFGWLIYPILYLIVILIRGCYSNYYPYPFVNVTEIGIQKVIFNVIYLTMFFGIISIAFVGLSKYSRRRDK